MDLSIWYTHQFIQNEQTQIRSGAREKSRFKLAHLPVLAGSVTATVYRKDEAIQTLQINSEGVYEFNSLKNSNVKAVSGKFSPNNGAIEISWNEPPGENYLLVSYEYEMDKNDNRHDS